MEIYSVIALGLVSTAICILLKQYQPEYALFVSIICGVIIFAVVIDNLLPTFALMSDLMVKAQIKSSYVEAIVKTLGVCYITQLVTDSCKDAGQNAIASKVELASKVYIVLLALPLFEDLITITFSLINPA